MHCQGSRQFAAQFDELGGRNRDLMLKALIDSPLDFNNFGIRGYCVHPERPG